MTTSMTHLSPFNGDDLPEALAGLRILDNVATKTLTIAEKRKKQWEENCKKHTNLLKDWHSLQICRYALRAYRHQTPGPRCFNIQESVVSNVYKESVSEIPNLVRLKDCSRYEYARSMKLMLEAEEVHQAVEMRKYDRVVRLDFNWIDKERGKLAYCRINLPNLTNWSPSLVATDYVFLYDDTRSFAIALQIKSVKEDFIYLPNDAIHLFKLKDLEKPLNVSFVSSGTPFRFCQMAIQELANQPGLKQIVFKETEPWNRVKINLEETNTKSLLQRLDNLNDSQRDAVIGIIKAECRPKPYILFGPPGTGKSHTLVAAVVQIYYRSTAPDYFCNSYSTEDDVDLDARKRTKILISVNSNTCTDDLYQKIRKELPNAKILRISAGDNPPSRELQEDIVVTTNIKSGCMFQRVQFGYIFIDEAGHANGAESLVPMCALSDGGCLVLAGDPKQLGPVVMCRQAAELGLETSLLEHLFEFDLYQRDSTTNKYDKRYITMLQECYRCDKRILAPCNRLFYDNDLICNHGTPNGLLRLLQLTGPIQATNRVLGKEERPEYSTSWLNFIEADSCVDLIIRLYKMGIEPEQIGVTTPYKLQQKEILKKLKLALRSHSEHLTERFIHQRYIEKKWSHEQILVLKSEDDNAKRNLFQSLKGNYYKKVGEQYFIYDHKSYDGPVTLYDKIVANNNWVCKVDSIDAFQGNEKEIMIISTVRTDANVRRLEFLNDARRFNVAVSRAKWLVFVIGSPYVLELGKYWPELVKDSKSDIDEWPLDVHDLNSFSQKPLFRTN